MIRRSSSSIPCILRRRSAMSTCHRCRFWKIRLPRNYLPAETGQPLLAVTQPATGIACSCHTILLANFCRIWSPARDAIAPICSPAGWMDALFYFLHTLSSLFQATVRSAQRLNQGKIHPVLFVYPVSIFFPRHRCIFHRRCPACQWMNRPFGTDT